MINKAKKYDQELIFSKKLIPDFNDYIDDVTDILSKINTEQSLT